MKKILVIAIVCLLGSFAAAAQTVKREFGIRIA